MERFIIRKDQLCSLVELSTSHTLEMLPKEWKPVFEEWVEKNLVSCKTLMKANKEITEEDKKKNKVTVRRMYNKELKRHTWEVWLVTMDDEKDVIYWGRVIYMPGAFFSNGWGIIQHTDDVANPTPFYVGEELEAIGHAVNMASSYQRRSMVL